MNEYKISSINMDSNLINLIDEYIKDTIKGYEKCRNEFVRDVFIGGNNYFVYLTFTKSKENIYYVTKIEFRNYMNGNIIAIYTSREPNVYGYPDWYISYTIRTDEQALDECDDLLKLLQEQIEYLYDKFKRNNDTPDISMNDIINTMNIRKEYRSSQNIIYHNSNIEFDDSGIIRINIDKDTFIITIYNDGLIKIINNSVIELSEEDLEFIDICRNKKLLDYIDKDETCFKNHIINTLIELYKNISRIR